MVISIRISKLQSLPNIYNVNNNQTCFIINLIQRQKRENVHEKDTDGGVLKQKIRHEILNKMQAVAVPIPPPPSVEFSRSPSPVFLHSVTGVYFYLHKCKPKPIQNLSGTIHGTFLAPHFPLSPIWANSRCRRCH